MKSTNSEHSICITAVDNGFIVEPHTPSGMAKIPEDVKVFQSMSELTQFIKEHFPFRCGSLETDQ